MADPMTDAFAACFANAAVLAIIIFICIMVFFLWAIVMYIITSLSLFRLGRELGVNAYGLAWVPVVNNWVLGSVADKYDSREGKDHKFRVALLIFSIIYMLIFLFYQVYTIASSLGIGEGILGSGYGQDAVNAIAGQFVTMLLLMVPMIIVCVGVGTLQIIAYYKLCELCKPEKPLKTLLIMMMVPFAFPFELLSCANTYIRRVRQEQAAAAALLEEEYRDMTQIPDIPAAWAEENNNPKE